MLLSIKRSIDGDADAPATTNEHKTSEKFSLPSGKPLTENLQK